MQLKKAPPHLVVSTQPGAIQAKELLPLHPPPDKSHHRLNHRNAVHVLQQLMARLL
jgi:hypothetical protein